MTGKWMEMNPTLGVTNCKSLCCQPLSHYHSNPAVTYSAGMILMNRWVKIGKHSWPDIQLSASRWTQVQVLGIQCICFPLLQTSCHMKFSFVVLLPFKLHEPYVSRHMPTLEQQCKGLIAVGAGRPAVHALPSCCDLRLCCALQISF